MPLLLIVEPKIKLKEVRLKVVAADFEADAVNPVLQIQNLPIFNLFVECMLVR